MSTLLADNAFGTLASGLAVGDTTLAFTAGHGARFPAVTGSDVLYVCLLNSSNVLEEVIITAHASGADSATITRGAGSTTAKVWVAGDRVEARISKTALNAFLGNYALLAGSATQTFSVAAATAAAHAVRLDQVGNRIAQIVTTQSSAVATGTTVMPFDDTIPQNTEGDEYLTRSITPTNASSTLKITCVLNLSTNIPNNLSVALFQDATAAAIAAVGDYVDTSATMSNITLEYFMTAGTTSATTFKIRAGGSAAGTTTFNGASASRVFGGVISSRITITEYLP